MRIAYYPRFECDKKLTDRYWRAIHYLGPYAQAITALEFAGGGEIGAPADYLDQTLPARADAIGARVRRVDAPDVEGADLVIVWDARCRSDRALRHARRSAILDPETLHEGDLSIEVGDFFAPPDLEQRKRAHAAFRAAAAAESRPIVHVFGAGPSLAALDLDSLAPGVSIVCNSIVKDTALMARLRPRFITAIDPIFHVGPSRHAQVFREALVAALDAHRAWFVIQERDSALYRSLLPERHWPLMLPIPVRFTLRPSVDLARRFWLTATRNVLTLAMLPVAAALGGEVRIYGCDGRLADENTKFWDYAPAVAFPTELEQQKQAHPGFFSIDYEDYYALHCETVRHWVKAIEARGGRVVTGTASHIPALAARRLSGVPALPPPPHGFEAAARRAYLRRGAQLAYGGVLRSALTPRWLSAVLRTGVRAARDAQTRTRPPGVGRLARGDSGGNQGA